MGGATLHLSSALETASGRRSLSQALVVTNLSFLQAPSPKPERQERPVERAERTPSARRNRDHAHGDGPPGKLPAWARGQSDRAQNLQREANEQHPPQGRRRKPQNKPAVPRQSHRESEADKRKKRMDYDDPMGAVGPKYKADEVAGPRRSPRMLTL